VDKDGDGKISLTEYFKIFQVHGIVVNTTEINHVIHLVGEHRSLNKENFVKIVQGSHFFIRSFDKMGGEVTQVSLIRKRKFCAAEAKFGLVELG
jgi:hypothetical protein